MLIKSIYKKLHIILKSHCYNKKYSNEIFIMRKNLLYSIFYK